MRTFAMLVLIAMTGSACSDRQSEAEPQVISAEAFQRDFVWSRSAPNAKGGFPKLAIVGRGDLYHPEMPAFDFDIALICLPGGGLEVWGQHYVVATDVGGPPALAQRFGLRSDLVSFSGEPVFEHTGVEKRAHYVLNPTRQQLSQLLGGDWFEVGSPFADGSGTVRYPAPPQSLSGPFLQDCDRSRGAG